jgi:type IV secretion system protein VirB10
MSDHGDHNDLGESGAEHEIESRELSREAYERRVPASLTGFRGINPVALVLGLSLMFAVSFVGIWSFIQRSSGGQTTVSSTPAASVGPAAPGIGENAPPTPIVPTIATPVPRVQPTPFGVTRPLLPLSSPTPYPLIVQQPPEQHEAAPPLASTSLQSGSKMSLEQPTNTQSVAEGPGSGGQTQQNGGGGLNYKPVYRNGRIVGITPADANDNGSGGGQSDTTQFASSESKDPNVQSDRHQVQFSKEEESRDVGYARIKSTYQLNTTTFIKARLLTKITSDLPGPVVGETTEPVYDSATHSTLVIPEGSKVYGTYDNEVVVGESRLLVAFRRIVFPDGREFDIGGQPGTDAQGAAGFSGDVNQHVGQLYTAAALLTVLGGVEGALTPQQTTLYPTVSQQIQETAVAQLAQLGDKIINKALDRPPTIVVRPPYRFTIIVTRDLPLDQYRVR